MPKKPMRTKTNRSGKRKWTSDLKLSLKKRPNDIITGDDNIVIAKYLDGIDGGRSLDMMVAMTLII